MSTRRGRKTARGNRERLTQGRQRRHTFLIVCEGERTEPNYFRSFPVPRNVVDVYGPGYNTDSLVEKAIELREQGDYDQVWCVFDRDDFPAYNFNRALQLASSHGIHIAYSNQAFELWYVLHFEYLNSSIERDKYIDKLHGLLGFLYKKNSTAIYAELQRRGLQPDAIRNAERLLGTYYRPHPEQDDPSTTVHKLVVELNKHIRRE